MVMRKSRGSRRWKDHPLDEVPAGASGVQDDPHPGGCKMLSVRL